MGITATTRVALVPASPQNRTKNEHVFPLRGINYLLITSLVVFAVVFQSVDPVRHCVDSANLSPVNPLNTPQPDSLHFVAAKSLLMSPHWRHTAAAKCEVRALFQRQYRVPSETVLVA